MRTKILSILFFISFLVLPIQILKAQENVVLNKPVFVSSTNGSFVGANAVDGDNSSKSSRWVSTNTTSTHWIDIDLQGNFEISEIRFWTGVNGAYNKPLADFQFQYWDGTAWIDIFSEAGNNDAEYVKIFTPVTVNNVGLYITKGRDDDYARIYEIEVYGVEVPLTAPSDLKVTSIAGTNIDLSWTDNSVGETGFYLERSEDGVNFTKIATLATNETTYEDTGLSPTTEYTYRVQAYSNAITTEYSKELVIPARPKSPTDLQVMATTGSTVSISWTDHSDNEVGFYIERAATGTEFEKIDVVGVDVVSYTDESVAATTIYEYRVLAHSIGGPSNPSNVVTTTTLNQETIPDDPDDLNVSTVTSEEINIIWTDHSDNESGFYIERSEPGKDFVQIASVGANVNEYRDTYIEPMISYTYQVSAYNAGGTSGYSNATSVTTPESMPDTPNGLNTVTISDTQVNLFWADNSGNELGFCIERSEDSGTTFIQIAQVEKDITSYSDKDLDPAKVYFYRIKAYNDVGESSYSNQKSATTKDVLPEAPSDLTVSLSGGKIVLAWADNSGNEEAFYIERTVNGAEFEQFDVVDFNITTYTDISIASGLTYTYRVLAYNQTGNSTPSNEVSISIQNKDILTSLEEFLGGAFKMYPNPFHENFHIDYTLTKFTDVQVVLHTITGEKIIELINESQMPGEHSIAWNGRDYKGNQLPVGVYLCKITVDNLSTTQRIVFK